MSIPSRVPSVPIRRRRRIKPGRIIRRRCRPPGGKRRRLSPVVLSSPQGPAAPRPPRLPGRSYSPGYASELDEESNCPVRLDPMPDLRNDDRARRRIDPQRSMNRGIDMVLEPALDHVNSSPHPAFRRVLGSKPVGNRCRVELRRPAIRGQSVGPLHPVAAHAVELAAQHCRAPCLGRHPRPHHQRRPVTHVPAMARSRDPRPSRHAHRRENPRSPVSRHHHPEFPRDCQGHAVKTRTDHG